MKKLLYAAALAVITVLACQKEVSDNGSFHPDPTTNTATVVTTVAGRITDETGAPVQGALVKAGTASGQTNINGQFRITNASLKEKAAYVTVEKAGYFTGSRTFVAKAGHQHYVEVELLKSEPLGTINSTSAINLSVPNGPRISIPANSVVVKSSGAPYTGAVQVAMKWIDPTAGSVIRQMPGDLRGIDESGVERGLQSFGMIGVELSSPAGVALQIAPGKAATLQFPVPAAISGAAPATIALWWFNDSTGLWKQEGLATKNGGSYTAQVSHFSFWNCDAPFPVVEFSAKLVNQNGQALANVLVKIRRTTTTGYTSGWTDSSGNLSGLVPSNEPLVLEVYATSYCNSSSYSQNIGPFSSATSLGTITATIASSSSFSFTGSVVNCSNAPVTSGYVEVVANNILYRAPLVNGAFSLSFLGCTSSQSVTYYAVDNSNNQQSTPVTATFSGGTNNLGSLSACGLSNQRFINFTIDGTAYTITSPPDSTVGFLGNNTTTYVDGFKNLGSTTNATYFSSRFTGNSVGTAPLTSLYVRTPSFTDSITTQTGGTVNITEYGSVGAYIGGNFNATLIGINGTHTVQGTFRVRRTQ